MIRTHIPPIAFKNMIFIVLLQQANDYLCSYDGNFVLQNISCPTIKVEVTINHELMKYKMVIS